MLAEDLFRTVFYEGKVNNPAEFVDYIRRPENVAIFFFEGDEPLAAGWLNAISDCRAFGHFCTLRGARGRAQYLGRLALAYWFTAFEWLRVVLGLISAENRLARRYVRQIGFREVGEIPDLIHDAYRGVRRPGVLTYFVR